jgi:branched-chain amino acid transport system ATP-binding protein
MKAFRGDPSLFASADPEKRQAHLEVKDLTLKFGGITALSKIDFSVQSGELISLIGPNGAGKTSLLDCLSGVHRPQSGKIALNGEEITNLSPHRMAALGIGRTYQTSELFERNDGTVQHNAGTPYSPEIQRGGGISLFKGCKREEARQRQIVEELIDFLEHAGRS